MMPPPENDRHAQGERGLCAAVIEQALFDLSNGPRKSREDAARFFHDDRLPLFAACLPTIEPDRVRSRLIERGILPPAPPPLYREYL